MNAFPIIFSYQLFLSSGILVTKYLELSKATTWSQRWNSMKIAFTYFREVIFESVIGNMGLLVRLCLNILTLRHVMHDTGALVREVIPWHYYTSHVTHQDLVLTHPCYDDTWSPTRLATLLLQHGITSFFLSIFKIYFVCPFIIQTSSCHQIASRS